MKTRLLLIMIWWLASLVPSLAQFSIRTAFPVLLIHPSPRAIGMGNASIASTENDAFAMAVNPAQLGWGADDRYFTVAFFPSAYPWVPNFADDFSFEAKNVTLGYNFKQRNRNIPLRIVAGYTRTDLDLGETLIYGENDPTPIGSFRSYQRAHIWSVGIGFDRFVKISAGWNFKHVVDQSEVSGTAHDFGLVLRAPIFAAPAGWNNEVSKTKRGARSFLSASLGYAQNNIGKEVVEEFIDNNVPSSRSFPLPRTARVGIGINMGIQYTKEGFALQLLALELLHEAEHSLVRSDEQGHLSYAGFLGDINFWENVIKGQSSSTVVARMGWEIGLAECFAIHFGRYREGPSEDTSSENSNGFSFRLRGAMKAARLIFPGISKNHATNFVFKHLEIEYVVGGFKDEEGTLFGGTKFRALRISFGG